MLEFQIQLVSTMTHNYSKLKHTTNSTNFQIGFKSTMQYT